MKRIFLYSALMFALHANAQKPTAKDKIKFHPVVQAGVLAGESRSAFQLHIINGVQYKTWFAGVGIGLDEYFERTMPLFADVRKDILHKASTPFVYANAGVQLPWLPTKYKDAYGWQQHYNYGAYYNVGAGYKLNIVKNHSLLFSAGYSVKHFGYESRSSYQCIMAPCPEYYNETKYILERLSFQIGWWF